MNELETELTKHPRWDIRWDGAAKSWWAHREYDKHAGNGDTLLVAVRRANVQAGEEA